MYQVSQSYTIQTPTETWVRDDEICVRLVSHILPELLMKLG